MKIFDAQIRSDTRTDDELRNLHYFDTERVVTTAHARHRFEGAGELLDYFDTLLGPELDRLERCGLVAHAALGILPAGQPRRAYPEVWSRLGDLLAHDRVVAVGEIGAWEDTRAHWVLFDRLVYAAIDAQLPVIVTPPHKLRVNMTYKMMARLQKLGMPPDRCLMNLLDERTLPTVIEEGFVGGVAVGYRLLEPRQGAALLCDVMEAQPDGLDRTLLNSSLRRGAADILGIPKTIVALGEAGMGTEAIEKLAFGNAERFFVRTGR